MERREKSGSRKTFNKPIIIIIIRVMRLTDDLMMRSCVGDLVRSAEAGELQADLRTISAIGSGGEPLWRTGSGFRRSLRGEEETKWPHNVQILTNSIFHLNSGRWNIVFLMQTWEKPSASRCFPPVRLRKAVSHFTAFIVLITCVFNIQSGVMQHVGHKHSAFIWSTSCLQRQDENFFILWY